MFLKNVIRFSLLLALTFFTFACDSSTDKAESTAPEVKAEVSEALPLTTTVEVTGGTIEGVEQDGILIYKGIPFAAPPVGNLRWKAPAPVQPWTGVKKVDAFCNACMQTSGAMGNSAPVSEDCLYLNVWTPAKKVNENLPVIYWVHGGGYMGGSTSTPMYDGTGFAKKGVVLVSVAYRLGPFGFLAHPELSRESGHGSGTYGMLDMVEGLEWVKENVAKFGGDPSNVTIFGHSAGGAAISLLAATPLTKGLFHRAICMSGGSFTPLQTSPQVGISMGLPSLNFAESTGADFLKELGVAGISEARALSAEDIQKNMAGGFGGMRFKPAVDGYLISNDLYSLYEEGNFNDTPVLVGHTSDEMGSFGGTQELTPEQFEEQIKTQYGSQADMVLAVYPHSTEAEATRASKDNRNDTFTWNTLAWSRLQTRNGKNKAYQYYFDYHPNSPDGGSGHGSDVPYAFQTLGGGPAGEPGEADLKLSDMISSYWINFAKTGDPNGPELPEWPAFKMDDQKVMVFDTAPGARPVPNLDRFKVLDIYFSGLRGKSE
ncbi:MAG: carboxylesterase family protein [Desulfobacteraceae bacterium]|jgi:para-nitrobenzyl esterase